MKRTVISLLSAVFILTALLSGCGQTTDQPGDTGTDGSSQESIDTSINTNDTDLTSQTDVAQTDAAQTDAAQTDAAQTDAAQTDAAQTDAAQTDAAQTDAAQTDAAQTDAAQTDAAQTDAAQTDETTGEQTDETAGEQTDETAGEQTDETAGEQTGESGSPVVYMTENITAAGLMEIYNALNASPEGRIAVKLSTGEPGSNYLRTDLIGGLVQSFNEPVIVECNTAYGGSRANTAMHYQVARDHGYTDIADVKIMDENGSMTLPVTGGDNLTENYVGAAFADYDYYIILSHFKGHAMAGYGGAIKNISIGIASSEGKSHIHSGGTGGSMWSSDQDAFLESMAEAGKSVVDYLNGNILYINVMNRLSVDCDCDGNPAEPDMHDIGILASYDPVALDQACIDLVYSAQDGRSLINRIESRNGLHTLEQAERIGLGSRVYNLVRIDD